MLYVVCPYVSCCIAFCRIYLLILLPFLGDKKILYQKLKIKKLKVEQCVSSQKKAMEVGAL